MNSRVFDKEPFLRLNPTDVCGYLQMTGWRNHENHAGYRSLWHKDYRGEIAELLLPADRSISDYLSRMVEAVRLVAAIEERSESELLSDLQLLSCDVLRLRLLHSAASDGTIPLALGERVVESTRELFLAAASAVNTRRAYYAPSRPEEVRHFAQNLRLGQSERGSYVLTVISRVAPELKTDSRIEPLDPPFERRAVLRLNDALIALRGALDKASMTFSADVFGEVVSRGVSANLCNALVGMVDENAQPTDQLQFRFTWARTRPIEPALSPQVCFEAETIPVIREAARVLKATEPIEDQEILGYVIKLQQRNSGGLATVATVIDGQPRKVTIELPEVEHKLAIEAYEKRIEFSCRGLLTRAGQLWALKEPSRVRLVDDGD
jgi:hypothetical protein